MPFRPAPTRRAPLRSAPLATLLVALLAVTALAIPALAIPLDTTPPVATASITRTVIWPANGGMFPVGFNASVSDDVDGSLTAVVRIYSDQGNGAPPLSPDAAGVTGVPSSLRLRAERAYPSPPGTYGRVYIVSVSATDTAGNTGSACRSAVVPVYPSGYFIVQTRAKAAAGEALCQANGGTIPPGNGYELLHTFTLPPPIKASPDSYDTLGNVRLDVPAASGVLLNDVTIDPPLTVTTTGTFASANLGTVDMDANGAFRYDPPPGFEGVDSFSYGIMDAFGRTAASSVSITVNEVIWFIDNTAAPGGDGRQVSPYDSFSAYSAGAADEANDIIHVDRGDGTSGDYDTGLVLLTGQQLIGEGVDLATGTGLVVPTFNTLPGAGTRPEMTNTGGAAIVAPGGNVIRGLDISTPVGAGISASGTGLTLSDVSISAPGTDGLLGSGLGGTVDAANLDVALAGGQGINLSSCTGTFTFDSACSVTNAVGTNVRVFAGTCAVTYDGDLSQSGPGGLVTVLGGHGTGAILFQSGTVGCTGGAGIRLGPCTGAITFANAMSLATGTDAIVLSSATGTNSFQGLTIASLGDGIRATGGGILNATGTNSVVATGGAALDLSSATLGMTFSSLTSTSSPTHGVRVDACSGSLGVTGLTDIDTPTADGLRVSGSPSVDLDFGSVDIDGGSADGIDINGGVGDFDIATRCTVDGTTGTGIRVAASGGDTFAFADCDIGATTAPTAGIDLTSSAGAAFTFADLDVTSNGGTGVLCDSAGTVSVTQLPTVDTTGAPAIDISNTSGNMNGTGGFAFDDVVSTNSTTAGIRFDLVPSSILLTDVDIDSSSTLIDHGIVFTDCTGSSKTVRRGHIVFTGTNDAHGVFVDNSDNVTIEGDSASAFDPIGMPGVFTGAFEITGMGTGSANPTVNGNTHGHHAVTCHDSNGLTVDRCYIHDIGDVGNLDASLDGGVYIDETTGGTVTISNNHFEDLIGSDAVHIGSPASTFAGTSTFDITFNRFVGVPAASPVSTQSGIQAAFDSTSGATIVGNFDDNRFEGMGFDGANVQVDLNVANGDTGTGAGGRNLFSFSRNVVEDPDNNGVQFDFGDDSVSRLVCDDNTFDASVSHTSFEFGPQVPVEVELRHDGATHNPVLDLFVRDNTIQSTNSGTQIWQDQGIRVQTASASGAGVGTIRALIDNNSIAACDDNAIEIQSDESNVVNAIVRDNGIDSSLTTGLGSGGVIELDTQSDADSSVLVVWLDGNETGATSPGYFVEEHPSPTVDLACEGGCPVSGTINTNADLVTLLSHNGNTSGGGGAPTVDATAGSVDVVSTGSVPAPTVRASGCAEGLRGYTLVGATAEDRAPIEPLLDVAKALWISTGLSAHEASLLHSVSVGVADLEPGVLARTWITHISLDADAAGFGWFVDATPARHEEFDGVGRRAQPASPARHTMDLLTVLVHEVGHVLGREHCACPGHAMSHDLPPGTRRLPPLAGAR